MDTITMEFNREAQRTHYNEWLLWLIFFLILEDYARRKRLAHQENFYRKLSCIPKP